MGDNMFKAHQVVAMFGLVFLMSGCDGSSSGGSSSSSGSEVNVANVTCSSFATQPEAQQYFETHNASKLDADNDGIACEHLPGGLLAANDNTLQDDSDISLYIGDYTLLAMNCGRNSCTAQSVILSIDSEETVTLCVLQNLQSNCDPDRRETYQVLGLQGKVLSFKYGTLKLGTIENGHVDLQFNDTHFYGQNILLTDTTDEGRYNNYGLLEQSQGHYQLTSYAGRVIQLDQSNQLLISQK